jgi:hypothetical protein
MPKHPPSFWLQGLGFFPAGFAMLVACGTIAGHGSSTHTGAAEGSDRRAFAELRGAGHPVPL